MRSLLLAILLAPLLTLALPSPSSSSSALTRRTHERRTSFPANWSPHPLTPRPHPSTPLPFRIALSQQNLHLLESELLRVSDPQSGAYGQHWGTDEVREFFRPSGESVSAVLDWLEREGVAKERVRVSPGGGWVELEGVTVEEAERLLGTEYAVYAHELTGDTHLACGSYSLPEDVRPHVDFVVPTLHFDAKIQQRGKRVPVEKATKRETEGVGKNIGQPGLTGSLPKSGAHLSTIINELENCDEQIVPLCLQALYSIPPIDTQLATSRNSYGIVEYTPQSYIPSDLDVFFGQFAPSLVGQRPTFYGIDGGELQTFEESFGYNGESDLDLQYAMTLVQPLKPKLYQVGDFVEGASFNNFLDALDGSYCTYEGGDDPTQDGIYPDTAPGGYDYPEACGTFPTSYVISTSYGYNEIDLTAFYEERQCNEYAKLGLMGVSVLYASGDSGVAGETDAGFVCLTPDGQWSANGTVFAPQFPGTCPYVTAVGATQVKPNATVYEAEEACEEVIYSSGGFSNVFAMPTYQQRQVREWYEKYPPPYTAAQYNNSMTTRAFPDIAANGANYVVAIDGTFELVYGTSCSSPVAGSIFSLINDARLAVNKAPVGFLNPALYAAPSVFNDITAGNNPGCGTDGFEAVPGWDPVTGLGTPDYLKLLAYYLSLP